MFLRRNKEKGLERVRDCLNFYGVKDVLNDLEKGKYHLCFQYNQTKERLIYNAYWSDYSFLPKNTFIEIEVSSNGLLLEEEPDIYQMALYVYLFQLENELDIETLKKRYLNILPLLKEAPSLEEKEQLERSKLRQEFLSLFDEKGGESPLPLNEPSSGKWELITRFQQKEGRYALSLEMWDGEEKKIPISPIIPFLEKYSEEGAYFYHASLYSLEHRFFLEKGQRILGYLVALTRGKNDSFSSEILLDEEEFGDMVEILLGENLYLNGESYYVMKDSLKAGFRYKNNGDVELIPPIEEYKRCHSLLLHNGLLYFDDYSYVVTLYRFANLTSKKVFAFFLKHGLKDASLVNDILKKKMVLSSSLKNEDIADRFQINLYVDISDNGSLSFKTVYLLCEREVKKEEAVLNASFGSEIALYLAELENLGGKEEGIQDNQKEALKFLQSDLSSLKKKAKIFLSKKLSRSKITHMGAISLHIERHEDWLSLNVKSKNFSSEQLSLILEAYRKKKTYLLLGDNIILLDDPKIHELNEIKQKEKLDRSFGKESMAFSEAFRLENEYGEGQIKLEKDSSLKEAFLSLKNFKEKKVELKPSIEKALRPYQRIAVQWLDCLYENHLGGILADDMGLGKTLETIAFLSSLKKDEPSLIIAPKSVIYNWEKEFYTWDKETKVIVIDGSRDKRLEIISSIKKDERVIYITSYDSLRNDLSSYLPHHFDTLITDEAQLIKNYSALKSKAVRNISSYTRFALTGTPIENSMGDLWSIFDFLMPNYLNTYGIFKQRYILAGNQEEARSSLRKRITPFLLRRTKKEVLKELPQKVTEVVTLTMDEESRILYSSVLEKAKKELQKSKENIAENHDRFSSFSFLPVLTSLREICVNPSSFFENIKGMSTKFSYVTEYAEKSISNGHKLLIFSSFTKVLDNLRDLLKDEGIASYYIYGEVDAKKRLELSNKFNKEKDVSVMLVSLKAGGTGLNLAGADVVIHLDPWWNIASEEQATDRAYRIGQKRPVTVLKLICHDSIEEKVLLLQQYKKTLYDELIRSGENAISSLSEDDIAFLLS